MNHFSSQSLPRLPFDPPPPPVVREADLDLTAIFRLIRRRATVIVTTILVMTFAALPFIMALEPVYHARARFLLHPVLTVNPTLASEALDLTSEVERIRSRGIADQIIAQFDLASNPTFNPELKANGLLSGKFRPSTRKSEPKKPAEVTTEERVLNAYFARLSVWREVDSQLIQVGFTAPDPHLAAAVPNAIITLYAADRDTKNRQRIEAALASIDQQISDQAANVTRVTAEIETFRNQSGVASVGRGAELDSNRVALLNEQIADIRRQRTELAALIATADAAWASDAAVAVDEPESLTELRQMLQTRKRELSRLQASYGDAYGGVRIEKARVEELQASVQAELASWISSMRVQTRQLDVEEQALTQTRMEDEQSLARTSTAEFELMTLIKHADGQREILELLEGQRRLLEARLLQPSVELEILSPSILPVTPEGRGRKTYLLFVIIASSLAALTLAGILEALDGSVRSDEQLEGTASILPLGKLPRTGGFLRRPKNDAATMKAALDSVLLNLKAACEGQFPESLAVTALQPQDGATKIARQLAAEIAGRGQDVLFVDSRTQGVTATDAGFSDYLRRYDQFPSDPDELLDDLIIATRIPHLYSLGASTGTRAFLHDDLPLTLLLKYAKVRNLVVIFACPGVFEDATTRRICRAVQKTVLALRWGHTPRALVPLAADHLHARTTSPLLTILHDVNLRLYALYPFRDSAVFSRPMRQTV